MSECVFCQIVRGELPADVVGRRNGFMAFRDIAPKAHTHVLVIPERHLPSIDAVDGLGPEDRAEMLEFIVEVAHGLGVADTGYRVVTNHGPDSLQSVGHLHWHILGGQTLSATM